MNPATAKPRIVAIVQARMGSTRLPGKVLRPIAGKPLLWHVVHRLKHCRTLDAIVIATSVNARDDAIAAFCAEENIALARGPEENVLERFRRAAEDAAADIVVRVSADAPFLDAGFIDHMVTALIEQKGDYVVLEPGALCAHEGVDPVSMRALKKLAAQAPLDPVAREHVTGYFKLHPDFVRVVHAPPYPRLAYENTRLTIDTPDDLAFAEALHARLEVKAGEAALGDLLLLLEREPRLKAMNAHVRQKSLHNREGLVLIRCDGGGTLGFGHVKRSLTLARSLRDREGLGVVFALNGQTEAAQSILQAGFEAHLLPGAGKIQALALLAEEKKPDILVWDARENLSYEALKRLAEKIPVVASIDDASERRLLATHAYYPPVPQVASLSWTGAHTRVRAGWEWALLGFDPSKIAKRAERNADRPTLVVSMGGSDPLDLTRVAARALAKITVPFDARFIIGPGFRDAPALARELEGMGPHFHIVHGVTDLGAEFAAADLALVTFGVTAYELAALGVPALYLAYSDDHALSASAFEEAGMGMMLGLGRIIRNDDIARAVWRLLLDGERQRDMRAAGLIAMDGRAGERIAADLASALAEARAKPRITQAAS